MAERGHNEGFRVLDDFPCEAVHAPTVPQAPPTQRGRNEGARLLAEIVLDSSGRIQAPAGAAPPQPPDRIKLTAEQYEALARSPGDVTRAAYPETHEEYVIVRAEVFERLQGLLGYDGDWTAEEQLRLLAESGKRAGWDDPEMDVYDNYDENHRKLCP